MMKAGSKPSSAQETIEASSTDDLMGRLADYVGADGSRMPWTKSVELTLPDLPENIRVVDTPGIDDPVPSREERTREFLHKCDVVFIISPAGQFLSAQDIELMEKISGKGVEQMYLAASQADNELFCSAQEPGYGDLDKRLAVIKEKLIGQAKANLKHLNEEVSPPHRFDVLVNDGEKRLALTSAICHTMNLRLRDKGSWDDGMNCVWGNLQKHYIDYFDSDGAAEVNLGKLSNIETVEKWVKDAQDAKDRIMEEKQKAEVGKYKASVDAFGDQLLKETRGKIKMLKNTDMAKLQKKKRDVQSTINKGREAVNGTFADCVDDFKSQMNRIIDEETNPLFEKAKANITDLPKIMSEDVKEASKGLIGSVARFFGAGGYEHSTKEYTEVCPVPLVAMMNDLVTDIKNTVNTVFTDEKKKWKATVQHEIIHALREAVNDDDAIDVSELESAIRNVIDGVKMPNLDFGNGLLRSPDGGTLKGAEAERFLSDVREQLSALYKNFTDTKWSFMEELSTLTKSFNAADNLLGEMNERLRELEKEIAAKTGTLQRLKQCEAALKGVA